MQAQMEYVPLNLVGVASRRDTSSDGSKLLLCRWTGQLLYTMCLEHRVMRRARYSRDVMAAFDANPVETPVRYCAGLQERVEATRLPLSHHSKWS
ncbi:proline iminopeptidase [Pseudozyma hubeiensis SY62]|uniref:Proline iminopeptidase n=1 Tax=Pseudozyma hubeiensis (strain SY62) TaxID=1305764 RepID=R9NX05_PSEHS|nr:proline iminopeptidase [Pseudozyma hubeiensis SY62]GAC93099.1 proline iminopeptidase [Pseudozyma hubeiensis SY62]